ncbi:hypothetical protein [Hymenobacter sp. BRD128]|uniref:hypothetical protein n=1 Tax=Hymenobacter sp. BRD128 TaxID=2675878 RepID=UPI0020B8BA9F|nr:hypothetical protein [Hymenobacter sp. BRD128]
MNTQLAPIVGPEATSILAILKVRLKNSLLYAEFTEQPDEASSPRTFTMQGTELVHPDLPHCLAHLVPHLCLLTEQLSETPDYWPTDEAEQLPELFRKFTVTGFSMGRGQAGVTLLGQRELEGGKVLNLTSPYLAFDDENSSYAYAGRLETAVLVAISEVEAALRGKVSEAGRQLALFENPAAQHPSQEVVAHLNAGLPANDQPGPGPECLQPNEPPVEKRPTSRITL